MSNVSFPRKRPPWLTYCVCIATLPGLLLLPFVVTMTLNGLRLRCLQWELHALHSPHDVAVVDTYREVGNTYRRSTSLQAFYVELRTYDGDATGLEQFYSQPTLRWRSAHCSLVVLPDGQYPDDLCDYTTGCWYDGDPDAPTLRRDPAGRHFYLISVCESLSTWFDPRCL